MHLPKVYAQVNNKEQIDLTLSVNPLGCSPFVVKALKSLTMEDISMYPDTAELIASLTNRFNVNKENIVLGTGSEQLIKLIAQAFCTPKCAVLVERGSFAVFTKECLLTGANVTSVRLEEFVNGTDSKLVFLANPKTPTGELIEKKFLLQLVKKIEPATVVIDEANGEFMDESFIQDAVKSTNVLVLRTFSKALGLAGLRIGVAIGPKRLIAELADAQQPFPVSQISVKLTAAALSDQTFIKKTRQYVAKERKFLKDSLEKRGVIVSNSVTNNLFINLPNADRIIKELRKRGVGVINGRFFPDMEQEGFRISLKDRRTNMMFLRKFDEALACVNNEKLLASKGTL